MSEDYDPFEYRGDTGVPRQSGYEDETEEICRYILEERGDQRIGQYLINAVRHSDEWERLEEQGRETSRSDKEKTESVLWNIEAPELLKAIEEFEGRGENR
ncbi:hypothetical protein [Haloplanus natans]|uniref:hypothetical protein n=1 Tax=Haloplanus natans TaxID=376171 RepID=UPI000677ED38|nr:hypothetical protein [Haloplanus natans]